MNHHSVFFAQRLLQKQNALDREVEQFLDNNSWIDRQLIFDNEPLEAGVDFGGQEIDDLYFSIFNNSPQEMAQMAEPFEAFQKELRISTCPICQEISLSHLPPDSVCSRCSKYPNLPPDQLSDLNQLNPFSCYNKMQPGAFFTRLNRLFIFNIQLN